LDGMWNMVTIAKTKDKRVGAVKGEWEHNEIASIRGGPSNRKEAVIIESKGVQENENELG